MSGFRLIICVGVKERQGEDAAHSSGVSATKRHPFCLTLTDFDGFYFA